MSILGEMISNAIATFFLLKGIKSRHTLSGRGSFSWEVSSRLSFEWDPRIIFVAAVRQGHELASTDVAGSGHDSKELSSAPNVA